MLCLFFKHSDWLLNAWKIAQHKFTKNILIGEGPDLGSYFHATSQHTYKVFTIFNKQLFLHLVSYLQAVNVGINFSFILNSCAHIYSKKDAAVGTSDPDIKIDVTDGAEYERTFGDDLYLHSIVCIVIVLVSSSKSFHWPNVPFLSLLFLPFFLSLFLFSFSLSLSLTYFSLVIVLVSPSTSMVYLRILPMSKCPVLITILMFISLSLPLSFFLSLSSFSLSLFISLFT